LSAPTRDAAAHLAALQGRQADLGHWLEHEPAPLDFVLPHLLAGTIGVLYAPGGRGKGFFLLQAAIAVACCGPGADPMELGLSGHGRAVYLSAEDPETVLHHRFRAMCAGMPPATREELRERLSIVPAYALGIDVASPAWCDALAQYCEGARLVVVDTFRRIHHEDENDNGKMADIMGRIEQVAAKTGAAILLAHHVNKGGESARGATAIVDNSRCGMSLITLQTDVTGLKETLRAHKFSITRGGKPLPESAAHRFVRVEYAKVNYGHIVEEVDGQRWLERGECGVLHAVMLYPALYPVDAAGTQGGRTKKTKTEVVKSGSSGRAKTTETGDEEW
jgi:hypothetical protein